MAEHTEELEAEQDHERTIYKAAPAVTTDFDPAMTMDDTELLEQQMILQAIAESNKLASTSNTSDANDKSVISPDNEEKQPPSVKPAPAPTPAAVTVANAAVDAQSINQVV